MQRRVQQCLLLVCLCLVCLVCVVLLETPALSWGLLAGPLLTVETACGCSRRVSGPRGTKLGATTCSRDAWRRGTGQRVIGFSLYEVKEGGAQKRREELERDGHYTIPTYYDGMEKNLNLSAVHYPGWTLRLYHDLEAGDPLLEDLCRLSCQHGQLDLCDVRQLPGGQAGDPVDLFPMVWRWLPTLDPQVDIFASRDLDSTPSAREAAAVAEWLQAGKRLHSMRDNPYHNVPMLGGGWGTRLTIPGCREAWQGVWEQLVKDPTAQASRLGKGADQVLLASHVWDALGGAGEAVQHDSYTCRSYSGSIGWPTQREVGPANFFGSIGDMELQQECPEECRREAHKEWTHC